jgi:hypothetical protein
MYTFGTMTLWICSLVKIVNTGCHSSALVKVEGSKGSIIVSNCQTKRVGRGVLDFKSTHDGVAPTSACMLSP